MCGSKNKWGGREVSWLALEQLGGKKCSLPFESPEVMLRCWDTWGRSNQSALPPAPHCFFHSYTGWFFFFFSLLEACKPLMNSRSYPWSRWPGCQKTVWHQVNLFLTTTWGVGCGAKGDVGPSHSLMEAPVCLNSHGKISKASHKSQREPGLSLKFLFHYCCFQAFPERLQK